MKQSHTDYLAVIVTLCWLYLMAVSLVLAAGV